MGHVLIQESARKPMAIRIVLREIVIEGGTKRENRIEKKVASQGFGAKKNGEEEAGDKANREQKQSADNILQEAQRIDEESPRVIHSLRCEVGAAHLLQHRQALRALQR